MKVRLKFSKTGALVYIGHLDVMRYFQKLFRRSKISVAYSEGFSPHQILSFTPPLPLGMESEGEYADVELKTSIPTDEALARLREQSVPEIEILSFKALPEKCANSMAAVNAARYSVKVSDDVFADLVRAVSKLLKKNSLVTVKKTKKNEKEIDIRPLIYELCADDNGRSINMLISSGSTDNIKPELVMSALADIAGCDICLDKMTVKRIDQYTFDGNRLVSLDDIGDKIQ